VRRALVLALAPAPAPTAAAVLPPTALGLAAAVVMAAEVRALAAIVAPDDDLVVDMVVALALAVLADRVHQIHSLPHHSSMQRKQAECRKSHLLATVQVHKVPRNP
jgi:hypothetical protein